MFLITLLFHCYEATRAYLSRDADALAAARARIAYLENELQNSNHQLQQGYELVQAMCNDHAKGRKHLQELITKAYHKTANMARELREAKQQLRDAHALINNQPANLNIQAQLAAAQARINELSSQMEAAKDEFEQFKYDMFLVQDAYKQALEGELAEAQARIKELADELEQAKYDLFVAQGGFPDVDNYDFDA